jgi:O-antigen/teichoic acid export membrane protein
MPTTPDAMPPVDAASLGGAVPTAASPAAAPAPRRLSMFENSIALIGAKVLTMGLGFVFWVVAARFFAKAEVGVAAAVVATMMLCTQLALLGVGSAVITLLREHAAAPAALLDTSLTFVGVTAFGCAAVVVLLSGAFGEIDVVGSSAHYALVFTLATVVGTAGILYDQISTALRRGDQVLVRGAVVGLATVLTVVALGPGLGWTGSEALLVPWVTAGLAGCALGWAQIRRTVAGYRARVRIDRLLAPRVASVGLANWALTLAERAPGLVLPVVVAEVISAEANASWYAAWMMAWVVYIVPIQVGMTVFAEVAGEPERFRRATRHGVRSSLTVGGLGALIAIAAAPLALRILGEEYAADGVEPLRILVVAVVPLTFVQVYFATCRATRRLAEATVMGWTLAIGSVVAGAVAATAGGLTGIAVAWLVVQGAGGAWAVLRLVRLGALRAQRAEPGGSPP